jgi:hypothetical protein
MLTNPASRSKMVIERARELGINGPKAWKNAYGVSLDDITVEDALETMNDHSPAPDDLFPDRWQRAISATHRSQEEVKAGKKVNFERLLAGHREYFRREAAADGHTYPEIESEGSDDRNLWDGPLNESRPMFGEPAPRKRNRIGPRSGDTVLSGVDGRRS